MYAFKHIGVTLLIGWFLLMTQTAAATGGLEKAEQDRLRIHVVFNNVTYQVGLKTGWGFACLLQGLDKTVLFDTGGNGELLLDNMHQLGLDPKTVEAVVLSHSHGDHTGGLGAFLAANQHVIVYLPESFPAAFQQEVKHLGATVETVSGPQRLFDSVYSTGEMGDVTREQALIVDTSRGLIVITGCGTSEPEIRTIIKRLKTLGVRKVAPSHCTGDTAIRLFREAWKDDFIEGGLGAVIDVSR